MKPKELLYLCGIKPPIQFCNFNVEDFPIDGGIKFARWLAPRTAHDLFSQAEVDDLKSFLREGDFAIDIGAHIGDSTLPIALACGTEGAVLAVEPNPVTFKVLAVNASLNRSKTNIYPLPFAATNTDTSIQLDYNNPWLSNGGFKKRRHGYAFSIPVNGTNIARYAQEIYPEWVEKLRYIKIDVEGQDYNVLLTLSELIEKFRPYLKVEVCKTTSLENRSNLNDFFALTTTMFV